MSHLGQTKVSGFIIWRCAQFRYHTRIYIYIRVVTHVTVSFYASQTLSGAEKSLACETNVKRTWLYSGGASGQAGLGVML